MQQIGNRFGVKRQAVHDRFRRAGIKLRPSNQVRKVFSREILVKLYDEDKLTIGQIAKKLNVGFSKVSSELKRHGIEKRPVGENQRKHPEFWSMKKGDTLIVPRPRAVKPFSSLYGMAKNAGIKISIKTIDKDEMLVTCLQVISPRLKSK